MTPSQQVNSLIAANLRVNVNVKDYGAKGDGTTDDSAAIQSAITAAQTRNRIVEFPIGCFRCNIVVPKEIRIKGAGGGTQTNFVVPTYPYDVTLYPTVLIPASSSTPCIRIDSCYGVRIDDIAVIGQGTRVGEGITFSNNTSFCGSNATFNQVTVQNFNYGIANYGAVDLIFNACVFTQSNNNVNAQGAANTAPSDTMTFNQCVTGGLNSTWNFYLVGCRAVTIISGDHNLAQHIAYLSASSTLHWVSGNSEQSQLHCFEIYQGKLKISAGRFSTVGNAGGNKAIIRATSVAVEVNFSNTVNLDGTGYNGMAIVYETAGTEYPKMLPNNSIIQRYVDTTFAVATKAEFTNRVYRNAVQEQAAYNIRDEFVKGYSSPFGSLGWFITTVAGAGGAGRSTTALGSQMGTLEIYTGNVGTEKFRLALEKAIFYCGGTFPEFEMEWWFSASNIANCQIRVGIYTNDTTVVMTPQYGIGIRADATAGVADTTIKFELINNNVVALVDTGVATTVLNSLTKVVIRKISNNGGTFIGYSCQINSTSEVLYTTVIPTFAALPAFFLGSASANYATVDIDRFSLRF